MRTMIWIQTETKRKTALRVSRDGPGSDHNLQLRVPGVRVFLVDPCVLMFNGGWVRPQAACRPRLFSKPALPLSTIATLFPFMNSRNVSRFVSPPRRPRMGVWGLVAVFASAALASPTTALAEEPAEAFVKQLRSAGYFDVALTYLDRMSTSKVVSDDFRSSTSFEKAQVYFDLAKTTRDPDLRDEYLAKTENALLGFVQAGQHPRTSEAQLQLGSMQLIRANQLMAGTPDENERIEARKAFLSAAETFSAIVKRIRAELESMRGAKINASKDPEAASRRDRLRGEYLQGLVSAADARKMAAETYPNPAEGGKKLLEEALVDFKELAEKYDDYVQGVIAFLYAGEIHEQLGQTKEATNAYLRMLEVQDADDLRESKFRAATGLVRLAMAKSPPDFKTAIAKGSPWVDAIRPNERRTEAATDLQLNVAKALLAKSKDKNAGKSGELKRAKSDARSMLNAIAKFPGRHAEETKAILADLGVTVDDSDPLPVTAERPKSFDDALEQSRALLKASEELNRGLQALKAQGGNDVESQKQELSEQLSQNRGITAEILRMGLAMINPETDPEDIRSARQFLAYTLFQSGRHRDAMVVGNFLAKSSPGTEPGLAGGLIAMNSLRSLLIEDETNESLIGSMGRLGDFLSSTWPEDESAAGAKGVLVQLALRGSRWDQATALIGEMGEGTEKASLQRLLGRMMYADSIVARRDGDESKSSTLVSTAENQLRSGLKSISGALVDENSIKAALALAKIELKAGKPGAALKTLNHPKYGPVPLSEKLDLDDAAFKSDLYGTELRALVGQMTSGGDTSASLQRAVEVMDRLRSSVSGDDSAAQLSAIYLGMARDIREQIDNAPPERRGPLVEAFRVFLEKMSESNDDPSTLQWIGQTLMTMAEATIPPGSLKATGESATLLKTALATFQRLKDQGGEVSVSVDFQLARGQRLSGKYKNSIDTLESILQANPMMLDAQIEAATAYEQWASVIAPKFAGKAFSSALGGARPAGPQKKNVIWGWGKISQLTSRNAQFREKFFQARYHVALCRFLWGKAEKNNDILAKAVTDITKVASLYPELGSPEQRNQFDKLLRRIQTELGQPATGLKKPSS